MADSSDPRGLPDRDTIELALRLAEPELAGREQDYWCGATSALRWALGQTDRAPASSHVVHVDLEDPRRVAVMSEAEHAYHGMYRRREREDLGLRYLTGVENTLMRVVTGSGFAKTVDLERLCESRGIGRALVMPWCGRWVL